MLYWLMADEVNLTPKTSWTIPLLLVLSIFSLSISGYLFWQNQQLMKQLAAIPTPMPLGSPQAVAEAADPTAGWKTYSIDELQITFKLPPELTKPGVFTRVETPSETGKQICWALDMKQGFKLVPVVLAGGGSCTLNLFTIGATTVNHEAGRMSGFADYKTLKANTSVPNNLVSQMKNLNDINIIKILGKDENGFPLSGTPGEGYIGAILKNNDNLFQVYTVQMKLNSDLTPELFDQILSTFKFIP